jgi:Tol biopolymer transport system component
MRIRVIIGVCVAVIIAGALGWCYIKSRQLTTGATITSNGEQFAFLYWGGGDKDYDVYVQDINAEKPVQLTQGYRVLDVQWLPDGNRLSFVDADSAKLYTLDVVTGDLQMIRQNITEFEWSPDGARLAWYDKETGQAFIGDPSGDDAQVIEPSGYAFAWSPDGARLAYIASFSGNDNQVERDMMIFNMDGGETLRINREGTQDYPDWSPDGRYVRFLDDVYEETFGGLTARNILVYDVESDSVIDLERFGSDVVLPEWSQDSQRLLFEDGDSGAICEFELTGEMGDCYGQGESAVWNADNSLIAYEWDGLCIHSLNIPEYGDDRCFFDWKRQVLPVSWRP